jgi:predicted ATPase
MFVSVFYGVLDIRDNTFTFARAGHNPLLIRGAGGLQAHAPGGSVLGFMTSARLAATLEEASIKLAPGDLVVIYTDGLTEAMNGQRKMWGDHALREAVTGMPDGSAQAAIDVLLGRVDAFRQGEPQNDDEALMILRPLAHTGDVGPLQLEGGLPETNLPPHATSLIGREVEVAELLAHVSDPDAGVITVVGTAGIGKTRVALGAASLALGLFAGGVWHTDLGEIEESEGVCKKVGEALGVDLSSADAGGRVGLALQGRTRSRRGRLLLVLDNVDQCRNAVAELVDQWRALSADVKVLLTTRAGLGVSGERVFAVRPLGVPLRKKTERIEVLDEQGLRQIARMPSVELFVARARERDPRFELTRENADAVGQLCVRLDGIPLAIELAAARAKVLSPQKMVERLNQRFALLRDQRGTSSRQSTLRGAIEWSWELLDEHERVALAQLSVLRGGFFLEQAEQIVQFPDDAPMVMDVVESLHDKSLLDSIELAKLGGERRFNMFESIRAFAIEQLHAQGHAEATEARWRRSLTQYARDWHGRSGNDESRLRLQLELEALAEIGRGKDELAWHASLIAGPMLQRLGSPKTARDLLANAAANCTDDELKSRLHISHAMAVVHSDPNHAEAILSKVPEDSPLYVDAVLALGQTYQNRGRGAQMIELLNSIRSRKDLSPLQSARVTAGLGNASIMTGDVNAGLDYYSQTLKAAESLDDAVLQGQVTGNLGVVYNMKGDFERAFEHFNKALTLMQAQEHQIAESYWLVNIAGVHEVRGEWAEAEAKLNRALKLGRENGLQEVTAAALGSLAMLALKLKRPGEALELVQQALEIDVATGNLRGRASHLSQLAQVRKELGDVEGYEARLREVIELGREVGDRVITGEQSVLLAIVEHARAVANDDKALFEQAASRLQAAIADLDAVGASKALDGRVALADCLWRTGRQDEARRVLDEVLSFEPRNDADRDVLAEGRKLKGTFDGNGAAG